MAHVQQLAAQTATSMHNNHRSRRQAHLVGVLCRVCNSLDVCDVLRHVIICARDWANGNALCIRIWVRDIHNTNSLSLCAVEYIGKRPSIQSHLTTGVTVTGRAVSSLVDRADARVVECFTLGLPLLPQQDRRLVICVTLYLGVGRGGRKWGCRVANDIKFLTLSFLFLSVSPPPPPPPTS